MLEMCSFRQVNEFNMIMQQLTKLICVKIFLSIYLFINDNTYIT